VKYGLDYMKAPVAPVIVRSRTIYQTALERGRSAEEMTDKAAAREIAELWAFVADTVDLPAGAASRKPDANGARAQPTP
jgi:chromosome partitioning protein